MSSTLPLPTLPCRCCHCRRCHCRCCHCRRCHCLLPLCHGYRNFLCHVQDGRMTPLQVMKDCQELLSQAPDEMRGLFLIGLMAVLIFVIWLWLESQRAHLKAEYRQRAERQRQAEQQREAERLRQLMQQAAAGDQTGASKRSDAKDRTSR